jgi:hypothetical protein
VRDRDGTLQERTIGSSGGRWQPDYDVPSGVMLVGFSGAIGWYFDTIQFHFDDGKATPRYGGKGGDTAFDLRLNWNEQEYKGRLRGFYGSRDRQGIETLGFVFEPAD